MNERIKELIEQAYDPEYGFIIPEKFAELIANECMTLCDETRADYFKHRKNSFDFQDKNIYAEGEAASDMIKYKIKKRFEIENPPTNDVDRILRTVRTRS